MGRQGSRLDLSARARARARWKMGHLGRAPKTKRKKAVLVFVLLRLAPAARGHFPSSQGFKKVESMIRFQVCTSGGRFPRLVLEGGKERRTEPLLLLPPLLFGFEKCCRSI